MDPQLVSTFKEYTGVKDDQKAVFYLKESNFNVMNGVNMFMDNPSLYKPQEKPIYEKKKRTQPKRVGRIGDFQNGEKEENKQEFFGGGGQNSGTAFLGNKYGDEMIRKAKEQRNEHHEEKEENRSHWDSVGSGNRLGADNDTSPNPSSGSLPPRPQKKQPPKEITVKIALWSDGIEIDGDFKPYSDPKNVSLFKSIVERNELPPQYSKGAAHVNASLEDKRKEKYTPPPKQFNAFEGSGQLLGGPRSSKIQKVSREQIQNAKKYRCDLSRPHTTILVRFHDGTRMKMKFNLDDTIDVLYSAVRMASNVGSPFDLMTAFPRKVLNEYSQTIESAGLKGSSITQNLK